jgi:hypothetical protein
MPSIWDLIPVSSVPVQPFTCPPVPWPGGPQGTAPRSDASVPTAPLSETQESARCSPLTSFAVRHRPTQAGSHQRSDRQSQAQSAEKQFG